MLDLIQTRRDLHQIPERSSRPPGLFAGMIGEIDLGYDFVWRIDIHLQGIATIGWRTDIDRTNRSTFASQRRRMPVDAIL